MRAAAGARAALDLMDHPVKFIGTVQIGITVFGIALGAVGQPLLTDYFDSPLSHGVAYALAFLDPHLLSVALGELVPKALALQRAEPIAKMLAIPLEILQTIVKPFTWLLQVSANAVTRLFGVRLAPAGELAHTEEDIRHIVAASEDAGVIATTEEEMLYKVFDFADKEVHEVMVPRPQVVAISIAMPTEEALAALLSSPYTRYPVYRDSLDEIVGILHVRDLSALHDRGSRTSTWPSCSGPPTSSSRRRTCGAPRRVPLEEPARGDRRRRVRGDAGDRDAGGPARGDRRRDRGRVRPPGRVDRADRRHPRPIDGTFPIDDFNEQFGDRVGGRGLPHDGRGSSSARSARAPEVGDGVEIDGLALRVIEIEGLRIQRLEVEFRTPIPEAEPVEEKPYGAQKASNTTGSLGSASTSVTSPSRIVKRSSWSMSIVRLRARRAPGRGRRRAPRSRARR